jgi:hypothetical protein
MVVINQGRDEDEEEKGPKRAKKASQKKKKRGEAFGAKNTIKREPS